MDAIEGNDRAFPRWLARITTIGLLAAAGALAFLDPALAGSVPTDEAGFTSYVARAFSLALHDSEVWVKGPLRLSIKPASGGEGFAADLHTTYSYCQRNPEDCERAVAIQVAQMSAAFKQSGTPLDRKTLRAVVRTTAYIDKLRQALAGKGEPVAAPLIADLWVTCVFDLPTAFQYAKPADLDALGLSRDEAIALGRKNVAAALRPFDAVLHDLPPAGIGHIEGDAYEASRILFPEEWKAVADKVGGKLIVAVPATDVVLYGRDDGAVARDAMMQLMRYVAQRANRPLSPTILRWKPDGWEAVQ